MPRHRRILTLLAALVTLLLAGTAAGLADPVDPALGHDVSYPQCGRPLPDPGGFAIVGVNGGMPGSANPCLAEQYRWAARSPRGAGLYANVANPGRTSTFYWPAAGARDPAPCGDRDAADDPGCAYDYGWHAAQHSLQVARDALGAEATGATVWWLDVETTNSWTGSPEANTAVLQAAIDALRDGGVGTVGIYSTASQWATITGGYTGATAGRYRAAWSAFTPRHALERAPLWVAGLGDRASASANCGAGFTGGPVRLAQFTDGPLDGDVRC